MASHNGVGAVMGSKMLKAIVVDRTKKALTVSNPGSLSRVAKELVANALTDKMNYGTHHEGTVGGVIMGTKGGMVPVRNYLTSVSPMPEEKLEKYSAENIRSIFNAKREPCWACAANHCQSYEITEGKYAGRKFDEPEYEGMSAFSELVGINDVETTVLLASEEDLMGVDVNEDTLAIELSREVGISGSFLDRYHTLENFQDEFFLPDILNRKVRENWKALGSRTLTEVAEEKVRVLIEKDVENDLDNS